MQLIAVTGGIASGKSAVSARLAEHGAVVVDADRLAREVVEPGTPALARIAEEFGPEFLTPEGVLDRARLGALVFADPEKRRALNAITHPAIGARSHELFAAAAATDPDAVVVYDVPLLVDADRTGEFDRVVAVVAEPAERVRRMVELRGMDRADAERRITAQASDAERVAIADVVIDANGSLEETLAQADALWDRLRKN
ncbi:dephospho-CoA kinase [Pseudolysinimonas sp.]|uniref:dephospho-CoA kinase n=1 Tax=Pseudolysinimonas sp. TaxID=2680009 RepID=UPI003F82010B